MQYITDNYLYQKRPQKQQIAAPITKWLRRVYTTGFIFFFVKGLAWIIAAWFIF